MRVELTHGMDYNPLAQRWSWSNATPINYALVASRVKLEDSSSGDLVPPNGNTDRPEKKEDKSKGPS